MQVGATHKIGVLKICIISKVNICYIEYIKAKVLLITNYRNPLIQRL